MIPYEDNVTVRELTEEDLDKELAKWTAILWKHEYYIDLENAKKLKLCKKRTKK